MAPGTALLLLLGVENGHDCLIKDSLKAFLGECWALQVALGSNLKGKRENESWERHSDAVPASFYSLERDQTIFLFCIWLTVGWRDKLMGSFWAREQESASIWVSQHMGVNGLQEFPAQPCRERGLHPCLSAGPGAWPALKHKQANTKSACAAGEASRKCWGVAELLHTLGSSLLCPASSSPGELLPGESFQLVSGNREASFWDRSVLGMLMWHKHLQRPGKAASAYSATLWLIQFVLLIWMLWFGGPRTIIEPAAYKGTRPGSRILHPRAWGMLLTPCLSRRNGPPQKLWEHLLCCLKCNG